MTHRQLTMIAGSVAAIFLSGSVFGCTEEGDIQRNEDTKRIIMGAEKIKKRKKTQSENKQKKLQTQKTADRGED